MLELTADGISASVTSACTHDAAAGSWQYGGRRFRWWG